MSKMCDFLLGYWKIDILISMSPFSFFRKSQCGFKAPTVQKQKNSHTLNLYLYIIIILKGECCSWNPGLQT